MYASTLERSRTFEKPARRDFPKDGAWRSMFGRTPESSSNALAKLVERYPKNYIRAKFIGGFLSSPRESGYTTNALTPNVTRSIYYVHTYIPARTNTHKERARERDR